MSRWRNTLLSSPFGVSEHFRPRVRVPLPRSPRLAKDLQTSSQPTLLLGQSGAEEKTSNPQPGRCEGPLFTTLAVSQTCRELSTFRCPCLPQAAIGAEPWNPGLHPHCRGGWVGSLRTPAASPGLRFSFVHKKPLEEVGLEFAMNLDSEG